ncbi:PREDICTED: putative DNA helicase INO80 [Nelumbo nucifera]|uniref:DNA helicase INO80 n=1 Tax=Nelumbo nucifera TaxID=4432 RepID=A0A1U8BAD6_NELNU|nr:PREDICTED: putative DNA helicase INO80 [Nelumbo nucifera]
MDVNSMAGRMMSGMAPGMLGLEMPLHQPQQQQHHPHQQLQQQQQHHHHHQMMAFAGHDNDHHSQVQSVKQHGYAYATKGKPQQPALSDEEEQGLVGDDGGADARKRMSPWQRMKWTDNMVRLLIMVVFYIGDDGGSEGNDPSGAGKKKPGGLLQKKGKWKSVSRAMMEKGFYVSPQQCEDKFNDLNKRYKRVNDILGKGTACKVVENQSLLETMDQLSPKMKEEVRKLLNSKHLFFREMCAYHNSCGGGVGGAHHASEAALESENHQQQQHCFHSPEGTAAAAGNPRSLSRSECEGLKLRSREEEEDDDGEDDDDDDDDGDEDEDDEDESMEIGGRSRNNEHGGGGGHEEEDDNELKLASRKKLRKGMPAASLSPSPSIQHLNSEMMGVLQDGTKSSWDQRQWMRNKSLQLEEQRVSYQCQAFGLEKQRLKWIKFSGKKEREMERMKLKNERMRLENERMLLLLREKELELLNLRQKQQQQQQHSSNKRPDQSG